MITLRGSSFKTHLESLDIVRVPGRYLLVVGEELRPGFRLHVSLRGHYIANYLKMQAIWQQQAIMLL